VGPGEDGALAPPGVRVRALKGAPLIHKSQTRQGLGGAMSSVD
jgi:hypothetical protein